MNHILNEKLITYILKNYDGHINKNSISTKNLKQIYDIILNAYKETKKIKYSFETVPIHSQDDIIYPTNFAGKYLPDEIKQYIISNAIQYHEVNVMIGTRKTTFYFVDFEPSNKDDLRNSIFIMIMWMFIAKKYSLKACAETVKVFIYLTPFEKKLPTSQTSIISPINVNTGYTRSCQPNGEIVLYRKEEWLKVFLHEAFHLFGLDFSTNPTTEYVDKLKMIFNLNCEFLLFEAYCEFWARLFNIGFTSFMMCEKKQFNIFQKYSNALLSFERVYSVSQFKKILSFMNLEYSYLYSKEPQKKQACKMLYKENSNVFAYYVLTSLLLNNVDKTMDFFEKKNYSLLRFHDDVNVINQFVDLIDDIKDYRPVLEILKVNPETNDKMIKQTLRMTLFNNL